MKCQWLLITVTYNSADVLRWFWKSGPPVGTQWVVVDNASKDETVEVAETLGATVIRLPKNVGFSAANNVGLSDPRWKHIPYLAFVNPDVTLDNTDFDLLSEALRAKGGLIAPRLRNADGSLQQNARGYPSLRNKIAHRVLGPERTRHYAIRPSASFTEAEWLMGAFIACDRTTMNQLGGWNEAYFLYYEDADLGLRARAGGYVVGVLERAEALHGWARETTGVRWGPWRREMSAAWTFYRTHRHSVWRKV